MAPRLLLSAYHFSMSAVAALAFGLPARGLVVIGVTGTKGKTTTCGMLHHILQQGGFKAGLISTAEIAIGYERRINDLKMTTPSRTTLQRLLRRMATAGCTHVVLETSSEALAQWRHFGIPYAVAVFTNLAPEHLEAHGSLAAYRQAKGKLFQALSGKGTAVVNLDDAEAGYFLHFPANKKIGFTIHGHGGAQLTETLNATIQKVEAHHALFTVNGVLAPLLVGGEFNVMNALAALGAARALEMPLARAVQALTNFNGTPGRLEFVETGKNFSVVVDYAHTPESLEAVYITLERQGPLVAVLGSCGGGRDKAKREPLGKLAGTYARAVIVTDEDPYDEEPRAIMEAVARGARAAGKRDGDNLWVVPERRQAIQLALSQAQAGDTVVITGKGSEQWLCVAGDKKIPWDDRTVVREELLALAH